MWKQIELNKRRSLIAVISMCIFLTLFGASIGYYFSSTMEGIIIGAFVLLVLYLVLVMREISRNSGASELVLGSAIYKYDKEYDPRLYNIVEEMTIASGMRKVPDIYVLDTIVPNAFACGVKPEKSAVYVTKGLLEILDRNELQGVIAHEIAHIVNRDTTYLICSGLMVVLITTVARALTRGLSRSSSRNSKGNGAAGIILLIMLILAPVVSYLFYFALSRKREYLADACAAQYTRYPQGLASALNKISRNMTGNQLVTKDEYEFIEEDDGLNLNAIFKETSVETSKYKKKKKDKILTPDNSFLCASCIIPLEAKREKTGLFSTHPNTKDRINILLKMTGADYYSYNEAFSKVTGEKGVINKIDVEKSKKIPIKEMPPMIPLAATTAAVAEELPADGIPVGQSIYKKDRFENKLKKKRETDDFMRKLAKYTLIDCECLTTLKVPPCYKGQEIICPHCKAKHVI